MELNELMEDEVTVQVPVTPGSDRSVSITYAPSRYTPAHEKAFGDEADATNWKTYPTMVGFLDGLVTGWDLTDQGEPLPVNEENLARLPLEFIVRVVEAVADGVAGKVTG